MDLDGLVRIQNVHVPERPPEEALLIRISAVLVEGYVVQEDPHQGVELFGAVCVHDVVKLRPVSTHCRSFGVGGVLSVKCNRQTKKDAGIAAGRYAGLEGSHNKLKYNLPHQTRKALAPPGVRVLHALLGWPLDTL